MTNNDGNEFFFLAHHFFPTRQLEVREVSEAPKFENHKLENRV